MKSIRISTEANRDIEEIANYIFDLNPVAAYQFLDQLDETLELLAGHPLIDRLRPELGSDPRSFAVGDYLVFYYPIAEGVNVARVIYGGRDLPRIFRQ